MCISVSVVYLEYLQTTMFKTHNAKIIYMQMHGLVTYRKEKSNEMPVRNTLSLWGYFEGISVRIYSKKLVDVYE